MNKSVALVVGCVIALAGPAISAQKGGKLPSDIPVVTALADSANGSWLRVSSDTKGAYVTTTQVGSKISVFQSGSDWFLTTYYARRGGYAPSNRSVVFDLSERATFASSLATPITAPTAMQAHLITHCSRIGVDMLKMSAVPGEASNVALCPGSFRFWAPNGSWYRLSFAPDSYTVDPLKVTCIAAAADGCTQWTVTPAGTTITTDPNPKNYTRLLQIDQAGNILAEGDYYWVSFSIIVAR